jgi:hypothetical protein
LGRQEVYRLICLIAERDYADVVERSGFDAESARIFFVDGSFLEIWLGMNKDLMYRFAFHWERRQVNGRIYRHDNAPHARWRTVASFPLHFHDGVRIRLLKVHCLMTLFWQPNVFWILLEKLFQYGVNTRMVSVLDINTGAMT